MSKQHNKDLLPSRSGPEAKPAQGLKAATATPGKVEPAGAAALLQAAVAAAKQRAAEKGPELKRAVPAPLTTWQPSPLQVAGLGLVLGLGWLGGWATFSATRIPEPSISQQAVLAIDWNGLAAGVQESHDDVVRLTGDVRTLKAGIEALKDAVEKSKQETAAKLAGIERPQLEAEITAKLASLTERLERADASEQGAAAKLARVAERLEKADAAERETGTRLAQIIERLDRLERPLLAAAPAAPAPTVVAALAAPVAEGPAQTGSLAEPKPAAPKPSVVEGWVLREVYDGLALLEGKNQRLIEVAPGESLPGVGRVEAIERRGKTWVVVTSKGIISSQQW